MYITLERDHPFAFACLCVVGKSPEGMRVRSCTIITTQPNALMESIHDRMPVILSPDASEQWLDTSLQDEHALSSLLVPYPAEAMTARAVSRLVNDPRREGAELIA